VPLTQIQLATAVADRAELTIAAKPASVDLRARAAGEGQGSAAVAPQGAQPTRRLSLATPTPPASRRDAGRRRSAQPDLSTVELALAQVGRVLELVKRGREHVRRGRDGGQSDVLLGGEVAGDVVDVAPCHRPTKLRAVPGAALVARELTRRKSALENSTLPGAAGHVVEVAAAHDRRKRRSRVPGRLHPPEHSSRHQRRADPAGDVSCSGSARRRRSAVDRDHLAHARGAVRARLHLTTPTTVGAALVQAQRLRARRT
jgi:hypothetical protein